ncbi:MAG: 30S ribosomal protein S9 [bacterium]|nr:30S ribosomal protein S9 [bacterium]MDO8581591.1 30S ribosomal protein S9 [bacterium]
MTTRKYHRAVGGRKNASAQVHIFPNGKGDITVNGKPLAKYFPYFEFQQIVISPLEQVGQLDKVDVSVKVAGGGTRGQAEATRHGIALALTALNENFRRALRKIGYMTRDPRKKERKKPGLKRARRAPQWQKR